MEIMTPYLTRQKIVCSIKKLWKEYFWSRSFCLLTKGGSPIEVIKKYIEYQGMK